MKTSLLFMLIFLVSCSDYGEKKSLGNLDVYYTEGVTEYEAKDVGYYLQGKGFGLHERNEMVQLSKDSGRWILKVVMKDGKIFGGGTSWRQTGKNLSREVFNGAPVDVYLCDNKFNTLEYLPAGK